jgi:glycosyltransferase involved in cell wall biosynthesis
MSAVHDVLMVGAFPFPSPQGGQVYAGGMARALHRRGHLVRLATYGYGGGVWPADLVRVPVPAVGGTTLRSGPHLGKVALNAALVAGLVRTMRAHPPDVIHAHHGEAVLAAVTARRIAGVTAPVVYNLHTSFGEELLVYLPDRWRDARVVDAVSRAGHALDVQLAKLADAAVAPSRRGAELLRAWGAGDVTVALPGFDPAELVRGDAARARALWDLDDRPWVVYAGNLDPYQELDVLLAAMAQLPEAGLLVVTASPHAEVLARAAAAGLRASSVRSTGTAGLDALRDALAVASASAIPRSVCAGFPMKLLNTLASGVVTVVAAGSAPALEGVLVVPDRNPGAMAGALRSLLDDPEMTARLGRSAASGVRASLGWDAAVRPIESLYSRLRSASHDSSARVS